MAQAQGQRTSPRTVRGRCEGDRPSARLPQRHAGPPRRRGQPLVRARAHHPLRRRRLKPPGHVARSPGRGARRVPVLRGRRGIHRGIGRCGGLRRGRRGTRRAQAGREGLVEGGGCSDRRRPRRGVRGTRRSLQGIPPHRVQLPGQGRGHVRPAVGQG